LLKINVKFQGHLMINVIMLHVCKKQQCVWVWSKSLD